MRAVTESEMPREIRKVVVLGANGAMGSGAGEVFAAEGIEVALLARDLDKANRGKARAVQMAKADAIGRHLKTGTYERDFVESVAEADLVFEAVAEEIRIKQELFARVDATRKPDAIVATVSSGLSIAAMAKGRSDGFRRHFLGVHLFNPPNVIVGCEVIPHAETDPAVTRFVVELLERRLGRKVVTTTDTPAFAGNRIGFKVLNEVAKLAPEHGVAFLDALIGPHTGRAMPPLATIDFVGWDVHEAIVDNLHAHTSDEAHDAFALPAYMRELVAKGHLGAKTPEHGGFFRTVKHGGGEPESLVLDPDARAHRPASDAGRPLPEFARRMKELHRVGRYRDAMRLFLEAEGAEAELMRHVILGYVSYALSRVGEVVERTADVDRIMGFGFNWAPPGVLVDVLGAKDAIAALERAKLPVPSVLAAHADRGEPMFTEPNVDVGRFFFG